MLNEINDLKIILKCVIESMTYNLLILKDFSKKFGKTVYEEANE